MKRVGLFVLVLSVLSFPLFAGGGSQQSAKTESGSDTLLLSGFNIVGDKISACWYDYGGTSRFALYSRVLRLNSDLEPVYGDLAKSWTVSPDGLTYTFTLKDNIKWHDGVPFSAEDVAFSIKTAIKAPQVNGVIKSAFDSIKGAAAYSADASNTPADSIEGIKVNGNVITITMAQPSGTFLLSMAQFNILPQHLIEKYEPANLATSAFFDWPIGTGPYKLKEFKPNDYALLEVFDGYFGPKPQIRQIKLTMMNESDYSTRALANDIDYFNTNDMNVANAALKNPNYRAYYTDIYFIRFFEWNSFGQKAQGDDPIKDIRVRRAILHAIDRQALVDSFFPGQAALTDSKVPAAFNYYNGGIYKLDYNPEKAKQLLMEAKFDFGKTIRIGCYYSDQGSADLMDAAVYYLGQVGIKAEWFLMTGDLVAQIFETRDYNLLYAGLSAMAAEEAYNEYHSKSIQDTVMGKLFPAGYTGMDNLLEELWRTTDNSRRIQVLKDLQKKEADEALWVLPLFSLKNIQVFNAARVNLPGELTLSNEWNNYERYLEKWTLNSAK